MSSKPKPQNVIMSDPVTLEQYERLNYATYCEACTHFDLHTEKCTFGYPTTPHLKRTQLDGLKISGRIAFCRAMEID